MMTHLQRFGILLLTTLLDGSALAQPIQTTALPLTGTWKVVTSHADVQGEIKPSGKDAVSGFDLTYRFAKGSGFVIAQIAFAQPVDLPENYELSFTLSGEGSTNDLEVKLLDAADEQSKLGESVWWVKRRNYTWPGLASERRIINKAKHFQFAWGPLAGQRITKLGGVEIVVASASGGDGRVRVSDVVFKALPTSTPYTGTPVATGETRQPLHLPAAAIDRDPATWWYAEKGDWLTVDFGKGSPREFDAVRVDWAEPIEQFEAETSDDGQTWRTIWQADSSGSRAATSWADIPDTSARYLRVRGEGPSALGIRELSVYSRPPGELGIWPLIAANTTPGTKPRYFTGRQSSWTVLGSPTSRDEHLINEEGQIEVVGSGPMLDPLVIRSGQGVEQWSGGKVKMDFARSPMAVVQRRSDRLLLTVSAFVHDGNLYAMYELECLSDAETGRLALCLRPFQVNPPWQFLNIPGGLARVGTIEWAGPTLHVNSTAAIRLPNGTSDVALMTFAEGEAGLAVATKGLNVDRLAVSDPKGAASAAALCPFTLRKGERVEWVAVIAPRTGPRLPPPKQTGPSLVPLSRRVFERELRNSAGAWEQLHRATITLPPGNDQLQASIKSSLAYILINKDGPGFQPGSRSYERSWIRDGALTSAALLEFGITSEVREFIDWYAGYQFDSGAIPCVVDGRGAEPVVENDSHGQFIYALAEYHRHTRDDAFVRAHFPRVMRAVQHIQSERAKRQTDEFKGDATQREPGKPPVPKRAFYGLMPESISHEGYSAKPMHSYWDDFFTLKGLRDAAYLASIVGDDNAATLARSAASDLSLDIRNSITLALTAHGIDFIPGCPELGDFDATSTTIAINPCDALHDLPREWYEQTFDKWWTFFDARREGGIDYVDYTPYEWRIVGTLVMLGYRERAWAAAQWYMQDQLPPRQPGDTTPSGWLHWAEIVHKDRGAGKWIGDMPHTWVASDFLRSIRTMLVYERPAPSGQGTDLVLFAGVPRHWMETPEGVTLTNLSTHAGPITAHLRRVGSAYELAYSGLTTLNGKVYLRPPIDTITRIEVLEGDVRREPDGSYSSPSTSLKVRFH